MFSSPALPAVTEIEPVPLAEAESDSSPLRMSSPSSRARLSLLLSDNRHCVCVCVCLVGQRGLCVCVCVCVGGGLLTDFVWTTTKANTNMKTGKEKKKTMLLFKVQDHLQWIASCGCA